MKKEWVFVIISILIGVSAPLFGAVLKDDFLLNDDTTGMGRHSFTSNYSDNHWYVKPITYYDKPVVALSNNGNFVVTWTDERNGNSNGDIYVQIFDKSGQRLGGNFRANSEDYANAHLTPVAAMDNSGAFVVVWCGPAFRCRMFDSTGAPQGPNLDLFPKPESGQVGIGWPSVVSNGSGTGSYYVVYNAFDMYTLDDFQVFALKFARDGNVSNSWKLSDTTIGYGNAQHPAAAMNKFGRVVVVWNDAIRASSTKYPQFTGVPQDIYAERLDSVGHKTNDIFRVNEDTTGTQAYPSVGINGSGKFVVVWQDNRGGNYQIYGRRFTALGVPFDPGFKISDVGGDNTNPQIAMNSEGFFAVVWQNRLNGNIYGQRFSPLGLRMGGNFRVNATTKTIQNNPTIALNDFNQLVIAWQDSISAHPNLIRAQVYDPNGNPLFPEDIIVNDDEGSCTQGFRPFSNEWSSIHLAVNLAMNKKGNAVVLWSDQRNYADQFYGQVLDPEGNPVGKNFQIGAGFSVNINNPPGVALDSAGNFVVSWTTDSIVYVQRFDNTGKPRGGPMPVNWGNGADKFLTGSSVACDARGNFIVTWGAFSTTGNHICGQFYDKNGKMIGGNVYIDGDPTGIPKAEPCVVMNPAGAFIAGWLDGCDSTGVDEYVTGDNIYAQMFTGSRSRLGTNFPVNLPGSNRWLLHGPSVATDDAGNCVVMWSRLGDGVWTQRYDNHGKPVGENLLVTEKYPGFFCSVAMDSAGRFIGVWTNHGVVVAQRFNSDGTLWGTKEVISNPKQLPYQARSTGWRAVAANSDKILFVWIDNPRHKGWDVYAKITDWDLTGVAGCREQRAEGKGLTILPNPARNSFQIKFTQPRDGPVSLKIFDVGGRLVKTLIQTRLQAGEHTVKSSTTGFVSGVYFIRLSREGENATNKLLILRGDL
jgi:hypothetical protein